MNFAFFNSTAKVVTHDFLKRKCSRVDSSQKNFKSLNLYNNHVFAPQVKIFRCITFMAPNTDPSYPLNCLYWNISIFLKGKLNISKLALKVLANEKRGGLRVELFDRSPFKLFSLKFSNKSVQAPSCEGPKTTPRTLFLLFANNN